MSSMKKNYAKTNNERPRSVERSILTSGHGILLHVILQAAKRPDE